MDTVLAVELIKGRVTPWPRLADDHIMSTGSARPLGDAFRIAHGDLVLWLVEEFGLDKLDAYQLVSQMAEPGGQRVRPELHVRRQGAEAAPSGDVSCASTQRTAAGDRGDLPGRTRHRLRIRPETPGQALQPAGTVTGLTDDCWWALPHRFGRAPPEGKG